MNIDADQPGGPSDQGSEQGLPSEDPVANSQETEEDEFYPLAVLIEELRNEDIRFRLNSIQKLSTIALALGYEKTRTQLIPFLTDSIYDVEDVMVAIAEKMGDFVPYVGGTQYAPCLINPLESFALVEDATVREKAVQSLRKLAREHSDKDLQEQIFPLVRRLASGDWYSSRASACGLFAVVYRRLSPAHRQEILSMAQSLAHDDTPMVRRALAAVIGELALAMVGEDPDSDTAAAPTSSSEAGSSNSSFSPPLPPANTNEPSSAATSLLEGVGGSPETSASDLLQPSSAPSLSPIEETAEVLEARGQIVAALVPLYNSLAYEDEQESVRIIALEAATVSLARALGSTLAEQHLLPGLQKVASFTAWRARCVLAKNITRLQDVLGPRVTRNCLLDIFLSLLADDTAEVRSAAASQIRGFTSGLLLHGCEKMDTEEDKEQQHEERESNSSAAAADAFIVQRLLPAMADLNADSNVHVKAKLGLAVLGLAPLLGRELTITHLLPIILAQLKDESPDVRLGVISNLEAINNVIGVDQVSANLLPAVVELAKVPVWRIRLAVINQMPLLADQLGETFFGDRLMQHFLEWLTDATYAVREAAVLNLVRLTEKFGVPWAKNCFLSEIAQLSHNENYLQRMISLQCVMSLSPIIDAETCCQLLLPTALKMDHDRVPNVRFKVAQALAKVGAVVGSDVVLPCLKHLLTDPDTDVRFYAAESIDALKISSAASNNTTSKPHTDNGAEEGTEEGVAAPAAKGGDSMEGVNSA